MAYRRCLRKLVLPRCEDQCMGARDLDACLSIYLASLCGNVNTAPDMSRHIPPPRKSQSWENTQMSQLEQSGQCWKSECRSAAEGAEQCVQEFRSGTFKLCQVGKGRAYFRQKEIKDKRKNRKLIISIFQSYILVLIVQPDLRNLKARCVSRLFIHSLQCSSMLLGEGMLDSQYWNGTSSKVKEPYAEVPYSLWCREATEDDLQGKLN